MGPDSVSVFGLDLRLVLGLVGLVWGAIADRISARWPEHDVDGAQPEGGPVPVAPPAMRGIDWRTAVCIVIGALALAGAAARFPEQPQLAVFGAWAVVLVLLLATDLDQRLLPDVLTLPLIPAAIVVVLAGFVPFAAPADLPIAAVAAVAVPVGLYALSIPFGAGAFGLGDVKFLIGFGLLVGTERFLVGLVAGVLLAGVVIVALLALRRISLRAYIPYGPFLIVGALWAVLGPR